MPLPDNAGADLQGASKGRIDAALNFLRKAHELGFQDFKRVRRDPDFRNVVSQTEFAAITQ